MDDATILSPLPWILSLMPICPSSFSTWYVRLPLFLSRLSHLHRQRHTIEYLYTLTHTQTDRQTNKQTNSHKSSQRGIDQWPISSLSSANATTVTIASNNNSADSVHINDETSSGGNRFQFTATREALFCLGVSCSAIGELTLRWKSKAAILQRLWCSWPENKLSAGWKRSKH